MKKMDLRTRFVVFAVVAAFIPLCLSLTLSILNNRKVSGMAAEASLELGQSDLEHIAGNIYSMCRAQDGLAGDIISNALKTSRSILEDKGTVAFSGEDTVAWNAVNQFTKDAGTVMLPKMTVGGQWLGKNSDMGTQSPIVDKTRDLSVETCTIFQRMNDRGDMLRVCTNVEKLDGTRAIGTYIPAVNPDGSNNAVVETVMKGNTFYGRAFVVNAWYLTAYDPIFDETGEVAGILYVGIKQATLEKNLVETLGNIKIGETGYVFVVNSSGDYIVSRSNSRNGENAWQEKDSGGEYYIRQIVKEAQLINGDEVISFNYSLGSDSNGIRRITRIKYFKDWDWIICVDSAETEFLAVKEEILKLARTSNYMFLVVAGVTLLLVIGASLFFTGRITRPIMQTVGGLYKGAERTLLTSAQVTESSISVAEGSTEQAASVEETSSSLEEMAAMTRQNADNAEEANSLMKTSVEAAKEAGTSMGELTVSMDEISSASHETSKIIKTIDEIAFQTNLLALNAAVEAARAGDAGAGFAVVADEVRNLAMRAAEAAKNTAVLLEDTMKKVDNGAELLSSTKSDFEQMAESSARVGQLVAEIAAGSNEQAVGIEQINKAVSEIDKVIQTNAANSESNVGVSEDMRRMAENMRTHVATLAAIVTGDQDTSVAPDVSKASVSKSPALSVPPKARPVKTTRPPAAASAGEVNPEQILPLDNDAFEDF